MTALKRSFVAAVILLQVCASTPSLASTEFRGRAGILAPTSSPGIEATATVEYIVPRTDSPERTSIPRATTTASSTYTPVGAPDARDFLSSGLSSIPNPCLAGLSGAYCRRDARNRARWPAGPGPGLPPPTPADIARTAFDRALSLAPEPQLAVAPGEIGLTGLDSYFWLAEPPTAISATAGVPGLTVTATAVPVEFRWDFGDGHDKVTSSSGRRWTRNSDGNISHLYEKKGIYDISVEVIWAASYRINGGAATSLGYFSTSDARSYPVREMVAVLTAR